MKNITLEYAAQVQEDMKKLKRVIASCETEEQLKCAWTYYQLWRNKNSHWLGVIYDRAFLYMDGIARGMFLGRLNDEYYVKRTIRSLEE